MDPRQFYEDRYGRLSKYTNVSYSGGQVNVGLTAEISKADLSEEDLILLTVSKACHAGGIMDYEILDSIETHFIFHNPACTYRTTMDESLREMDRLKGRSTKEKVFADAKKDLESIGDVRNRVYRHVVEPLFRAQINDPDIVYLKQLCQRLPRSVSGTTATRQTSPF